jgi:hypothetical protein
VQVRRSIEKIEKKKDFDGLIEILRRDNWGHKKKAAAALERIGASAVDALIIALEDENRYIKRSGPPSIPQPSYWGRTGVFRLHGYYCSPGR